MSKAVLVLDMPERCIDCPCHFSDATVWCGINKAELKAEDIETYKPDWCPLRELPEKDDCAGSLSMKQMHFAGEKWAWSNGWNACIDAITGEEE